MTEKEIAAKLIDAKKAYYGDGLSFMSDAEFDALEEELRAINPHHDYFKIVGAPVEEGYKIQHKIPMLSMGKAKVAEDLEKWMKKLSLPEGTEYCLQPKIDGLSATCRYRKGRLVYVATRGDGQEGQDVSHIADYMEDIRPEISFTQEDIEIRGELYLPKNTTYDTKGKSLRNNCVGLINRKENREDLKHVRFVCYQIAGPSGILTEAEKIDALHKEGFHSVIIESASDKEGVVDYYNRYLESNRDEWNYETDGIIITVNDNTIHEEIDSRWVVDHHHHYAIAFKPPAEGKETELLSVEWQVSRQGNIIPVAVFKPVTIGGANLERASLHNYENVLKLRVDKGDRLFIERANDVIPYVKENLSFSLKGEEFVSPLIPESCPSCSSEVKPFGVHLKCTGKLCPETEIQRIIYWVKEASVDQVAEGTLRALFREGKIQRIKDLYLLKPSDFIGLEGFGDKKIKSFIDGMNRVRKMTPLKLLSRLGISLVQEKALKKLNIATVEDFLSFVDVTYVIGQNIISWKEDPSNMDFLNELLEVIELEEVEVREVKGKVCMTGKGPWSRKEIQSRIEEMGYEFSSSLTKDTDILLCEDTEGTSSKLKKAKSQGTELRTYTEFFGL